MCWQYSLLRQDRVETERVTDRRSAKQTRTAEQKVRQTLDVSDYGYLFAQSRAIIALLFCLGICPH